MALTEDAAAKIILIRSIEECDRNFFSDSLLVDAFAAARNFAPGLSWVKARAEFLFDHLSSTYQAVLHLARLPTPLTLPLCLIALVLGFATNLLGPEEKIHVVRNPVLLLVGSGPPSPFAVPLEQLLLVPGRCREPSAPQVGK